MENKKLRFNNALFLAMDEDLAAAKHGFIQKFGPLAFKRYIKPHINPPSAILKTQPNLLSGFYVNVLGRIVAARLGMEYQAWDPTAEAVASLAAKGIVPDVDEAED